MARPTDERKDRVIKVRITEEMYRDLMKEGDNLSLTIRERLKGGNIEELSRFLGGAKMPRLLEEAMEKGRVFYDGKEIRGEVDTDALIEICDRKKLNPQEVIDKVVEEIGGNVY